MMQEQNFKRRPAPEKEPKEGGDQLVYGKNPVAELLKSGAVQYLTLWDPALAGQAMVALAQKILAGEEISAPLDLGVEGYTALQFKEGSETVFEGQGWITITAENVDSFGF